VAKPTPEQILADPGAFTVDDVTGALAKVSPEAAQAAKELEAAGKQRVGILDWVPPQPEPEEPRFTRSRVLDSSEGPQIVGHIEALGRTATLADIAGALDGVEGEAFTRDEVRAHLGAYLTRPVA
jgi:hypothetical protein